MKLEARGRGAVEERFGTTTADPKSTHADSTVSAPISRSVGIIERNWGTLFAALTIGLDVSAMIGALALSRWFSASWWPTHGFHRFLLYSPVVYLLSSVVFGLYHGAYRATCASQLRRAAKSYAMGSLILLTVFPASGPHLCRLVAVQLIVILPTMLLLSRLAWEGVRRALQARGWAVDPTVLVVDEDEGHGTPEWVESLKSIGYDVRAVVMRQLFPIPGALLAEIDRQVNAAAARCILVPSAELVANGHGGLLDLGKAWGLKIKLFSPEVRAILARAGVHDESGISIERPTRYKIAWVKRIAKRSFDLVVASFLLILASPILILAGVAVKLESRGPLFFKQLRSLSADGPRFWFYKFRSMYENADRLKTSLRLSNESSGALFKIRQDPRLTRVGRAMRKLSADELPQLLNVIRGEMSLVGPRPLPVKDYETMTRSDGIGNYYAKRATVKPGITGLWQISGRSDLGFREMVLLDLYYVDNHTIFFDLEILLHTIPVVLSGRGAY